MVRFDLWEGDLSFIYDFGATMLGDSNGVDLGRRHSDSYYERLCRAPTRHICGTKTDHPQVQLQHFIPSRKKCR